MKNDLDLEAVLNYALGGAVPGAFLRHLLAHEYLWDPVFRQRLDELAYEFRPDLAVWQLTVTQNGELIETRLPLIKQTF